MRLILGASDSNPALPDQFIAYIANDTFNIAPYIAAGYDTVDYYIVGGGGGGGAGAPGTFDNATQANRNGGGGGGAGGGGACRYGTKLLTAYAGSTPVTLGAGGAGGPAGSNGSPGGTTIFDSISAYGGGAGGKGSVASINQSGNGGGGGAGGGRNATGGAGASAPAAYGPGGGVGAAGGTNASGGGYGGVGWTPSNIPPSTGNGIQFTDGTDLGGGGGSGGGTGTAAFQGFSSSAASQAWAATNAAGIGNKDVGSRGVVYQTSKTGSIWISGGGEGSGGGGIDLSKILGTGSYYGRGGLGGPGGLKSTESHAGYNGQIGGVFLRVYKA